MGVLGINLEVAIVIFGSVINLYEILKRLDVKLYKYRRERMRITKSTLSSQSKSPQKNEAGAGR